MKLTEAQIAELVLAYQDGQLSEAQQALLNNYLLENPELKAELEEFITLIPDVQKYAGPSLLRTAAEKITSYATEEGHPYEKLAIGNLEGVLSKPEQDLLKQLQQDQNFLLVEKQIAQTQLKPNTQILYPYTNALLKEAPIRSFNLKTLAATIGASAAAIFLTIFLIGQEASQDPTGKTNPQQHAHVVKTKAQAILEKNTHQSPSPSFTSQKLQHYQVAVHPHYVAPPPKDCIVPVIFDEVQPEPALAQNNALVQGSGEGQISFASAVGSNQNKAQTATFPNAATQSKSALSKEPVTVKSFLLQKTNERLFGVANPSTNVRYESLARYANESMGLPVRYQVEEAPQRERVTFQIGPISVERSRIRK
ncbi:MAG: hypothetical protein RLZZ65_70 [Bacteroidota bacterium]|jgi:hypothetical protein